MSTTQDKINRLDKDIATMKKRVAELKRKQATDEALAFYKVMYRTFKDLPRDVDEAVEYVKRLAVSAQKWRQFEEQQKRRQQQQMHDQKVVK